MVCSRLVIVIGFSFIIATQRILGCPEIVSRASWNARAPRSGPVNLAITPTPYVIVHHTATTKCNTPEACARSVRTIQNFHMDYRRWNDIAYNFLIGGDGRVYEGRNWQSTGAHALSYNNKSIGIALIGDFSTSAPPEKMTNVLRQLMACGVTTGKIKNDYKLLGHRQVRSTACPGGEFFKILKTWPHWSSAS